MKNAFRLIMICLLFAVAGSPAMGQEMLGLVNSNYAGSMGVSMNPSSMANSKIRVDYSIFTIRSFVENNYFYLPAKEASFFKIINGSYRFPFFAKPYGEGERNVYSYYMDPSNKNIFVNSRIDGPGIMFGLNDHILSIHTSYRMVSSTRGLPFDIANFSYYAMDFYPQHNIYYERGNYRMASMAWWEIGMSYATILARPFKTLWSAGITLNWLGGYSGAYLDGRETDYIVYNDSILNLDYLDGEIGLSLPVDYDTDEVDFFNPLIRGTGLGIDLGITFQYRDKPYMRKYKGQYYRKGFEDYLYKVGFSLLDLGWVTFNKDAEKHSYDGVSNHHLNVNYLQYTNIHDELAAVSELLYGDPDASYRDDQFRLYLPMAASVQFDYHPSGPWFLNGTLVVPLTVATPMLERPMILAMTPRYETKELEVSLPMIFYDVIYPRLGISVRFHGLTIGSDNLGGFLGYKDFTGYDFYINYKVNLNGSKKPFHSKSNPCWFN
jgi:hypothetical protein